MIMCLDAFKAYVDNKEVNLGYLFPTMVSNSIPVVARWLTQKIEVKLFELEYLTIYLVIGVNKGYVSNIHLKQIIQNNASNEILSEIEVEISQERLYFSIHYIKKVNEFNVDISSYLADGLGKDEIIKRLMPQHLGLLTIRLLEVMRKYPCPFIELLSTFYPFTLEMP